MEQFPWARAIQSSISMGKGYSVLILHGELADKISSYLDAQGLGGFSEPSEKEMTTKPSTADEINRHLNSLSRPPNKLVLRRNLCGQIGWQLEHRDLVQRLQSRELERVIKSQCGYSAVRIVRILSSHGDLEEKYIQEYGISSSQDLRQILNKMFSSGFIEMNGPYWSYKHVEVCRNLLEDTYQVI
jgi:hypothetical protein